MQERRIKPIIHYRLELKDVDSRELTAESVGPSGPMLGGNKGQSQPPGKWSGRENSAWGLVRLGLLSSSVLYSGRVTRGLCAEGAFKEGKKRANQRSKYKSMPDIKCIK